MDASHAGAALVEDDRTDAILDSFEDGLVDLDPVRTDLDDQTDCVLATCDDGLVDLDPAC